MHAGPVPTSDARAAAPGVRAVVTRLMRTLGLGATVLVCILAAGVLVGTRSALALPGARPPVPARLTALESHAEDLVDVALAHDRVRTVATARALAASAGGATVSTLRAAGAPAAEIAALRARVATASRLSRAGPYVSLALASNEVSGVVAGLYARFSDPVPVAVRRLDYLDREAQLRSLAGQRDAVPALVARLAATWAPLRPSVVAHGGLAVAASYAAHVAAMRRLQSAPGGALRREAENGLNLVDELEGVFTR
jgi:hypothetical protein